MLPVCLVGLNLGNPTREAKREYALSITVTTSLVEHIVTQTFQLQEDSRIESAQQTVKSERAVELKDTVEMIRKRALSKTKRVLENVAEKGSSVWLTLLPLPEMGQNLNKREFRDAIILRYDWPVVETPSTCAYGGFFSVDHTMICKRGRFVIQRHNEQRDL